MGAIDTEMDPGRIKPAAGLAEARFIKWKVGAVVGSVSVASSVAFVVARLLP